MAGGESLQPRSGPTRRRVLRGGVLTAALAAAVLLLSGCWATFKPNVVCGGDFNWCDDFVVRESKSNQMLWFCTVAEGTGRPRAECVLDAVRRACHEVPIGGFLPTCINATRHDHWPDMEAAITSPGRRCIGFRRMWTYGGGGPHDSWRAFGLDPYRGCP